MMIEKSNTQTQLSSDHEDEIDLIPIIKLLWKDRKKIISITLIFMGLGLFIAFFSPIKFNSTVVVKPILSSTKPTLGGNLGGLAAMAGINIPGGDGTAEIHPLLYPKIIESYAFQKELMKSKIFVENLNAEVSFEKYYTEIYQATILEIIKKYTVGLPSILLKKFKSKNLNSFSLDKKFKRVSETDIKMMELLEEQLHVYVDEKEGYVSLSATMPEKVQAAQLVTNAQNILQRKVIEHKLTRAQEDLKFIEERFQENKQAFDRAQINLAKYRDANKNVNTASARTEAEKLESEYELAFSVYSELAKQVETQKIQVKKNTPVFAVLNEAVVPLKKFNKSKIIILIQYSLLGVFVGMIITFTKTYVGKFNDRWGE